MKLEHTLAYEADPATIFAVLSDPGYVEDKCWATGATEAGIDVDGTGEDTVIRTVRTLPAEVPSYAKSFVGDGIEFDLTETWGPATNDGSRDGSIEGSFTGTPMKVRGTMTLRATPTGSEVHVAGEIKAGIPLVGGKLESFAGAEIVRGLDKEAETANEWLA
jgi:Protein of unknown function (DUF2505)